MFDPDIRNSEYMQVVLTHECNRRCPFCVDHLRGAAGRLTLGQLAAALGFARHHKIRDILFVGGEPTLHPEVVEMARLVKEHGLRLVVTTNFDLRDVVGQLMPWVDCWNFSYYGQRTVPYVDGADITLSALIYARGFLSTRESLDSFIDRYGDRYHLKFSTLALANEYCVKFGNPGGWLDQLPGTRRTLFDFICGQVYRGCLIKRYDIVGPQLPTLDSWKCLADGTLSRHW
jgi:hypothetical protein